MDSRRHVLVIEDERDIADLVRHVLVREGYAVTVTPDGEEGLSAARSARFDLVLLDLMLPGISGMELCRLFRSDPVLRSVPLIMLTAKSEEVDRVLGLELGADDYVTKPFSPRELTARIKALLRRSSPRAEFLQEMGVIRLGRLVIDPATYSVSKDGHRIEMSATEFRLLHYLARRPGRIFSRDQLLDAVWKDEAFVEPRTVDVHVRRLRTRIEDDPAHPVHIRTRRGVGYYVEAGT